MAFLKEKEPAEIDRLLEKDAEILEGINVLQQKIDSMDKSNKKFLMSATMSDGKTEMLEKEILQMKMGVIELLDQIDLLVDATGADLAVFQDKIVQITGKLGLEEIEAAPGEKFDAKEQDCIETVHVQELEEDTITNVVQKGYKDKNSGSILRYAKVSVNKY